MSDLKSKLPDMNELGSMAGKLFKDIKASVVEIIDDYKQKHPQVSVPETSEVVPPVTPVETATEVPVVKPVVTPVEKPVITPAETPEDESGKN